MSLYRKKLIDVYNSMNDKPLHEQKTYGDLSPEEWDDMRDKMGMKTDDEGNRYIDDPDAPPVDQLAKGNIEKIMVKLGGDAKTELKVSNQTDENGMIDLSNITLEFKDKKYEGLYFSDDDSYVVDNHDAIKYIVVIAEADDGTIFEVEVEVNRAWPDDDTINDINWRSLETFPSEEDQQGITEKGKRPDYADVDGDGDEEESMEKAFKDKEKIDETHCTEQEIEEGTCGYGEDGKIGRKPAGPNLMRERFQKLANITLKK